MWLAMTRRINGGTNGIEDRSDDISGVVGAGGGLGIDSPAPIIVGCFWRVRSTQRRRRVPAQPSIYGETVIGGGPQSRTVAQRLPGEVVLVHLFGFRMHCFRWIMRLLGWRMSGGITVLSLRIQCNSLSLKVVRFQLRNVDVKAVRFDCAAYLCARPLLASTFKLWPRIWCAVCVIT